MVLPLIDWFLTNKFPLARLLHLQTNTDPSQAKAVLQFWFEDCRPWQWFRQRDAFDALVSERFGYRWSSPLPEA